MAVICRSFDDYGGRSPRMPPRDRTDQAAGTRVVRPNPGATRSTTVRHRRLCDLPYLKRNVALFGWTGIAHAIRHDFQHQHLTRCENRYRHMVGTGISPCDARRYIARRALSVPGVSLRPLYTRY